jgi:hypothetical protein
VENLFAHDPFREGKVEETLFEAASALLKYVLVNGHAVPASGMEVNAEEGCVRVPYEGETKESAPILEDPSGEFDRTLRALRRARVVKSPPSAIGRRLARVTLSVGRDSEGAFGTASRNLSSTTRTSYPGVVGGGIGQGYE